MKFSVIVFPGSNCDHDAYNVVSNVLGEKVEYVWHKESSLPADTDAVIIPGGFSYGDYLRCGAIARFSNVMNDVVKFAEKGNPVVGVCNGFQILTEIGLLPGVLLRNKNLKFLCKDVNLRVENNESPFTNQLQKGEVITIPIAHGDGNYYADNDTVKELEDNSQIAFRYTDRNGNLTEGSNPNGSISNIAGITNKNKNVLGMMPHPERYSEKILGNDEGLKIFKSIVNSINSGVLA